MEKNVILPKEFIEKLETPEVDFMIELFSAVCDHNNALVNDMCSGDEFNISDTSFNSLFEFIGMNCSIEELDILLTYPPNIEKLPIALQGSIITGNMPFVRQYQLEFGRRSFNITKIVRDVILNKNLSDRSLKAIHYLGFTRWFDSVIWACSINNTKLAAKIVETYNCETPTNYTIPFIVDYNSIIDNIISSPFKCILTHPVATVLVRGDPSILKYLLKKINSKNIKKLQFIGSIIKTFHADIKEFSIEDINELLANSCKSVILIYNSYDIHRITFGDEEYDVREGDLKKSSNNIWKE